MITSPQNPKIKRARALSRRREREREGMLFLEGIRLVRDALDAGYAPETLFFTSDAHTFPDGASLVAEWGAVAWEVSPELMAEMTGTVTPQGIAAIVPLPRLPWPETPSLLLVADQVRDPGNLGTLLRSAAAAGVEGVMFPSGTVDVWSEKVVRAGMGAHFRIPIRNALEWGEALSLLSELRLYVADARGEPPYDEIDWRGRSALLVGGEADGATPEALARADGLIRIPMARAVESLNAAVAASVILFEAARQRR